VDLLAQMTTFVRVVETGSLSAAARVLGLSLPAVSRQISALETSVGGALVLRTTRLLQVTENGRRYYEHCHRVLREVDDAQGSVRRGRVVEGRLVVTVPVTFGLARVSPHLAPLLARHRGLSVDLRVEDRVVDLVREGVDVAIRTATATNDSPTLVERRLTSFRRVVVASPRYLRRRGEPRSPDALAKHDAIVHVATGGRVSRWHFVRGEASAEVEVRGSVASNAPYALHDAVLAGLGIAILPDWLVAADVEAGRLKVLLAEWTTPSVLVSGVFRTELRGLPRVRAFLDHLAAAYAKEQRAAANRSGAAR
jgi:DNA-binding transcriptional LysR family regulator